jgi:hypothetical protein
VRTGEYSMVTILTPDGKELTIGQNSAFKIGVAGGPVGWAADR